MGTVSGKNGKISVRSSAGEEKFITYITSWDFESSMDLDEASYFGGGLTEEGTKEKTPGSSSWTGSVAGAIDSAEPSSQGLLFDGHSEGIVIAVAFYLNLKTAYMGEAYVESFSISHAADGKAEFTASLSGNGKIKKVIID